MRTITESESDPRSDGFRMPGEFEPQTRAWMHALQWVETHHLDFINQRAYYRAIFNALASRFSKSL